MEPSERAQARGRGLRRVSRATAWTALGGAVASAAAGLVIAQSPAPAAAASPLETSEPGTGVPQDGAAHGEDSDHDGDTGHDDSDHDDEDDSARPSPRTAVPPSRVLAPLPDSGGSAAGSTPLQAPQQSPGLAGGGGSHTRSGAS